MMSSMKLETVITLVRKKHFWKIVQPILKIISTTCLVYLRFKIFLKNSLCYRYTVLFLSFRTDRSGQTVQIQIRLLLIGVYTVCISLCIFWMHYSKEKPFRSTFWGITSNYLVSEILGFYGTYCICNYGLWKILILFFFHENSSFMMKAVTRYMKGIKLNVLTDCISFYLVFNRIILCDVLRILFSINCC